MTVATPRLRAAIWLAALGIVGAVILGRPEPAAVAAPFALLALAGVEQRRTPGATAELRLERDRVEEGDLVEGTLRVRVPTASDRVEAMVLLPRGLTLERGDEAVALDAGEEHEWVLTVACERWGFYSVGPLRMRRYDRLRLTAHEQELDVGPALRVYPRREVLRSLARPVRTQASVGDQLSRRRGEGIELAELRPFTQGDDLRRINWRASARSGDLVVNELHPERNASVVLVVDAFADVGTPQSPLDRGVWAAVALADRYLARRDRVGLLVLGAGPRWLRPGSGVLQLHRIVDTLLEVRPVQPRQAPAPLHVPARLLPPQALVLALSPLLDDGVPATLANLRSRGYDLALLEIPPLPFLPRGPATLVPRLIALERDLLRSRLRSRGIAVVEWGEEASLEATVRTLEGLRRHSRLVRAS